MAFIIMKICKGKNKMDVKVQENEEYNVPFFSQRSIYINQDSFCAFVKINLQTRHSNLYTCDKIAVYL